MVMQKYEWKGPQKTYTIIKDGELWSCTTDGYINPHESPCGGGLTPTAALAMCIDEEIKWDNKDA